MTLTGALNEPLLFLLLLFSVTCHGIQNKQFINSCGDIGISFPFQLQGHPSHTCNDQNFTLSCDKNNRTVLQLLSGKYYVKSIDYSSHSIRLVDERIQANDICPSFPLSSLALPNSFYPPYSPYMSTSSVVFLRCEKPVQSPNYINKTAYCNTTRDDAGNGYHSYVVAGDVRVRDVADSCAAEVLYMSSSRLIRERGSDLSPLDFNRELGYGFEASWYFGCHRCKEMASCFGDSVNVADVCLCLSSIEYYLIS
ncbi:hypothetical protein Vadar_006787 [Vaccinium darrowii]|uniref:Uncharacterized protein n=1 Tax=Vaccinium darrowii TaxID=229202 RepID=A0ACB7YJX7_9ERIC|nr:hypothetical protein Vadar_006787 [Vaccinium darrowii]